MHLCMGKGTCNQMSSLRSSAYLAAEKAVPLPPAAVGLVSQSMICPARQHVGPLSAWQSSCVMVSKAQGKLVLLCLIKCLFSSSQKEPIHDVHLYFMSYGNLHLQQSLHCQPSPCAHGACRARLASGAGQRCTVSGAHPGRRAATSWG